MRRRDMGLMGLGITAAAAPGLSALAQGSASLGSASQGSASQGTDGSTWDAIRAKKVLRLGVTPSEPWYSKSVTTGTWSGMGVALANQVAGDMDCTVEFVETTWANAPAALQARQFDVMFVLDPTPARALAIDFPFAPVLYYALGIMGKAAPPATWAELDQPEMTIAVPLGTSMDRELAARLPHATVTRLKTVDEAILHYQTGRSRFLALFHPALIAYRLRIGDGIVVVPKPAVASLASAGIRREADKTWRDYLTTVLNFYYENGTTERLYREYLASRGLDPATAPGITKAALAG